MAAQRMITDLLADLPPTSDTIPPQSVAGWKQLQAWLADTVVSLKNGHGQIYLPRANPHTIDVTDANEWYAEQSPDWVLTLPSHYFSLDNGALKYTGSVPVIVQVAGSVSITCASNSQNIAVALGINGTPAVASEAFFKIGTGSDAASTALHLITEVSTNDTIGLFVKNETSPADITIETANIQATTSAV